MELPVVADDLHVDDRVPVDATHAHGLERRPFRQPACTGAGWPPRRPGPRNRNPSPLASGEMRTFATPYWPWPPVCFLYLPSASASFVMVSL